MVAVVEHLDRLAGQGRLGEQEQRQVRPLPGAIHREEAQTGGRETKQVAVGLAQRLLVFVFPQFGFVPFAGVFGASLESVLHAALSLIYPALTSETARSCWRASSLSLMLLGVAWISTRILGAVVACLCCLMSMNLLPNELV